MTIGIALLCVVNGMLYFSTTLRFRLRFSWRQTVLGAALFAVSGIGILWLISIALMSYLCEAVGYLRERRGLSRPSVDPNVGVLLIVALAFVVFPLLNDMYFRGAQASVWYADYNKHNVFYGINAAGFRGPRVPLARNAKPRLLFLGDSSPFGFAVRYQDAFPFVVQDILRARGIDVEVINAAGIGQSDGSMRFYLADYLAYRPDMVFLMTGVHYKKAGEDYQRLVKTGALRNPAWRPFVVTPPMLVELVIFSIATSPLFSPISARSDSVSAHLPEFDAFKTHVRAIVEQVRGSGAQIYVVDYPTPGANREVQDTIRRIAEEGRAPYIPLYDLIGNEIKSHLNDRIHPDGDGHRLIAREIARVAADALRKGAQNARAVSSR